MKKIFTLLLICSLFLLLAACSSKGDNSAPASGAGWILDIESADQGAIKLTDQDAEKIGIISVKATMKDQDSSYPEQAWEGVSLEQVLEHFGVKQYTTVKVEGADGSAKEYTPDLVATSGALLGLKVDGKKLDAETGPVQLVVNGKGDKWWIKNVVKISVIK